jgi:predicted secreted hydrolase
MNAITLQNIAQALWMKDYNNANIPRHILQQVEGPQNSELAYAKRFLKRLDQLEASRLSFSPDYRERYALLRRHCEQKMAMSPREFYASCLFLGLESNLGYEPVPLDPVFDFPAIDLPQLKQQLGWHFFVGNFTDEAGNHYSVELMFWQYAMLPPRLAAELGLRDIENQSLEMHLAICDPQAGRQYRANTVVVAGTTGLVEIQPKPFAYRLGRNAIEGLSPNGDLFPARLRARGWDMGQGQGEEQGQATGASSDVEIDIDLSLDNPKGYFMQGDDGCSPSIDGIGTLYYSAPLLKLQAGVENAITIGGKRIVLTGGSMWYDHQWTSGFMPNGAPEHAVLRAAKNLSAPSPGGWDWFELQFHDNPAAKLDEVQMTFSALHSAGNEAYYWQTGATPPGRMTAPIKGKFIDALNATTDITGSMTVTAWVRNDTSPNPAVYPPTNTWYPAGYAFEIDTALPQQRLKKFTLTPLIASGQTGFFGNGLQYTEGGAVVHDPDGVEIGRGFAEGTNWARTTDTVLAAAGLPADAQTRRLMTPVTPSPCLRAVSFVYTLLRQKQLKAILAQAKGMP